MCIIYIYIIYILLYICIYAYIYYIYTYLRVVYIYYIYTYLRVQTNVKKSICNEETVTSIDKNNTVLQVNVGNNGIAPKDTPEHQNKDNDHEKIPSSQKSQNARPHEKETSKRITKKNKN